MPAKKRPQPDRAELVLRALLQPNAEKYDRQHQVLLRQQLQTIRDSKKKSDLALWDEGNAFATIRDLKLFFQAGFGSMKELVEGGLERSTSWVSALMTFAESYPRALVADHGRKKIKLGENYAKLTLTKKDGASLASLLVRVPAAAGDEKLKEIPFAKASESDLEVAIKHQHKLASTRTDNALSVEERALLEHYEELVRDELAKRNREGEGGIRVRHSPDGDPAKAMADLSLPLAELAAILKRLAKGR